MPDCQRYRLRQEGEGDDQDDEQEPREWWACDVCKLVWCARILGDRWRPYACPERDQRRDEPIEPVLPIGLIDDWKTKEKVQCASQCSG